MYSNRNFLLLCFLLACCFGFSQKRKLSLNITCTYSGCEKKDRETIEPYANKMIMIVSLKGKVDSVRTDQQGTLKLKLKKGFYQLVEPWRYYLDTPGSLDISNFYKVCLLEEWQKVLTVISITRKTILISDKNPLIIYCTYNFPCLSEQKNFN